MMYSLIIKLGGYLYEFTDGGVDEVAFSQYRRRIVQQLLKTDIVAWLYGYCKNTVTVIRNETKLILALYPVQSLTLTTDTTVEKDVVRHIVMELDKVAVLVVDNTLVKVAVGHTELACLALVASLY